MSEALRFSIGRGTPPAAEASFIENFVTQWYHYSGLADTIAAARIRSEVSFQGRYPPVEGYNPFADPAALAGYERNLWMFRESQSPEQTEAIKRMIDASRMRAAELEAMTGSSINVSGFLAGVLTPGNLLTLPFGIAPGLLRGAATGALAALVGEGIDAAIRHSVMPAETAGDAGVSLALAALFGAAVGAGFGRLLDMQTLRAAAARHEAMEAVEAARAGRIAARGEPLDGAVRAAAREVPEPRGAASAADEVVSPPPERPVSRVDGESAAARGPLEEVASVDDPRLIARREEVSALSRQVEDVAVRVRAAERELESAVAENAAPEVIQQLERKVSEAREAYGIAQKQLDDARVELGRLEAEVAERVGVAPDEARMKQATQARLAELDARMAERAEELRQTTDASRARALSDALAKMMDERNEIKRQALEAERPGTTLRRDEMMTDPLAEAVLKRADKSAEPPSAEADAARPGEPAPPRGEPGASSPPPAPEGAAVADDAAGGGAAAPSGGGVPPIPPVPPLPERLPGVPKVDGVPADRIAPGSGMELLRTRQMPWHYLKNLPDGKVPEDIRAEVSEIADLLAESPGLHYVGEKIGWRPPQSVENAAKVLAARLTRVIVETEKAWYRHRGWDESKLGGTVGALRHRAAVAAERVQGREPGKLTWEEFEREVAIAASTRKHADPDVMAAARAHREFYDWYRDEMERLGMLISPAKLDAELNWYEELLNKLRGRREELEAQMAGAPPDIKVRIERQWDMVREEIGRVRGKIGALADLRIRLADLPEFHGPRDPGYIPHVWRRDVVKERQHELGEIIAKDWLSRATPGQAKYPHHIAARAHALAAHIAGEGPVGALRAVLRVLYEHRGLPPGRAAELAATEVAEFAEAMRESALSRAVRELKALRGADEPLMVTEEQAKIAEAILVRAEVDPVNSGILSAVLDTYGDANAFAGAVAGRAGFLNERRVTAPIEQIAPFLHLSARDLATHYHRVMAPLVETARRFGSPSMDRTLESLNLRMIQANVPKDTRENILGAIRDLRDVVHDRYGLPQDPTLWTPRALRVLSQWAVMTQMGKAALAAVADIGRAGWSVGFREMFGALLEKVADDGRGLKLAMAEVDEMGAAAELALLGRGHEMSGVHPGDFGRTAIERFGDRGTATMMLLNGLAPWTDLMKRFTGALLMSQIVRDSVAFVSGTISRERLKVLRERVSDEMAERIAAAWEGAGRPKHGRLYLAAASEWMDQEAANALREAVIRGINIAVPTPGAADRPLFMREPWGRAAFLYRGFALGATQRILAAGLQERDMRALSGIVAMFALSWLVEGLRISPYEKHPLTSKDRLFGALERSGVLGILTDVNTMIEVYSKNTLGLRPLLGIDPEPWNKDPTWVRLAGTATLGGAPAVEPWLQAIWAFTSSEAKGSDKAKALRRLVVFNNLIWWDGLISSMTREAGTALEGEN